MLKCEDCGNIFYEDELLRWKEERGEFWGQTAYEELCGCPRCQSGAIEEYTEDEEGDEE